MEGLGDVGPSPVLLSEKFKVLIQSYMYIALCLPGISNHTDVSCVCVEVEQERRWGRVAEGWEWHNPTLPHLMLLPITMSLFQNILDQPLMVCMKWKG